MNEDLQDMEDMAEAIVEKLEFDGIFDKVSEEHRKMLEADTEWTTPEYIHVHTLVQAFAQGILTADPWHHGYRIPPNFEAVMNWIAFCIQERFKKEIVPKLSLLEIEDMFRAWAFENPHFLKWNEPNDPGVVVAITSRYSDTLSERDFIDLDAILRNAVVFIRNEHRRDKAFDEEFEREQQDTARP